MLAKNLLLSKAVINRHAIASNVKLINRPGLVFISRQKRVLYQEIIFNRANGRFFASSSGSIYTQVLPGLGDSISSGIISEWAVKEGDLVNEGQLVAVIDTDKVSVDIQAKQSGKVIALHGRKEGDEVKVNEPLLDIDTSVASSAAASKQSTKKESQISTKSTETKSDSKPKQAATPIQSSPKPNVAKKESEKHEEDKRIPRIKFTHGKTNELPNVTYSSETLAPIAKRASLFQQVEQQKEMRKPVLANVRVNYGRLPPLNAKDMERVLLGGAEPYSLPPKKAKN